MTTTAHASQCPSTTVQIGDFLVSSWGYDQTNIDFYKIVGLTASGKSVRVQKWTSQTVRDFGSTVYVAPGDRPDTFTDWSAVDFSADAATQREQKVQRDAPVITKRLGTGWNLHEASQVPAIMIERYADAILWDGKPKYRTGFGFGH